MKLSNLSQSEIVSALGGDGVALSIGPFAVKLKSRIGYVARGLRRLYGDYRVMPDGSFYDFHIAIERPRGIRSRFQPQSLFLVDGETPFKPLPLNQAYPFFEWGLNWCVAQYSHQYLILHAAVVEKDGIAGIIPGNPGAGKSTLCASLVASGWRLLSDEMALIPSGENTLIPVPRPISLKNNSIDILKAYAPEQVYGDSYHDTAKGTIAHMKPPVESIERAGEFATPRLLIFPHFDPESEISVSAFSKGQSFLKTVECSFNYDYLGADGFNRIKRLISSCDCYNFTYSSLEEGLNGVSDLWEKALSDKTN
ncbi:MAG: HprK-related kinase A [Sedimenticola sp.]